MKRKLIGLALVMSLLAPAQIARAGDDNGNFMIRILGTDVVPQDHVNSLKAGPTDLKSLGFNADVSNQFIPAATLTYFVNHNVSVELFCCFSEHHVNLSAPNNFGALSGRVADAWIFPPALTLQYHFDGFGALKPYVGVGAQWIHFFNENTGDNPLRASSVNLSDAFGFTLQGGLDIAIGNGWYLNADVKKTWASTNVNWINATTTGTNVNAKVDLDPLIVSGGIGYRFNLEDIFGSRSAAVPLK